MNSTFYSVSPKEYNKRTSNKQRFNRYSLLSCHKEVNFQDKIRKDISGDEILHVRHHGLHITRDELVKYLTPIQFKPNPDNCEYINNSTECNNGCGVIPKVDVCDTHFIQNFSGSSVMTVQNSLWTRH